MLNWAKNIKYSQNMIRPANINELVEIAKKQEYTVLGGGHSFIDIYGGGELINIAKFKDVIDINLKENTVTAEAGIKIYELEEFLKPYKRVLCSVGSIREQTLAGSAANCVNSLGGKYINQFCDTILEITYIDNKGNIKKISGRDIKYYSVHLGSICGLIYSLKVKISDKTFLKYYDDYININNIQEYINNIFNSKTPILCEFMYFFNNPEVSVLLAEPFKDKTNIDETLISSNDNYSALKKNENSGVIVNATKHDLEFNKLVNKHGIKYVNRIRNHIKDGENIIHFSKLWFRGGKYVNEPITYIEFYIPLEYINDIIELLLKLNINEIAYYIQIRPFLKSKHLLCPSYKENVVSILFGTTVKKILKYKHIINILNFIGVRWHWGEALDICMYDGYIERVFSNKVRDIIEKKMINHINMRQQLKKAIKHITDYKYDWKTMFFNNLQTICTM